jgi:hypothetical protein
MAEATILQFPWRKMRPERRAIPCAGNDRFVDLACLSMRLVDAARRRPRNAGSEPAPHAAFLCAGIILGAIDRAEFTLD